MTFQKLEVRCVPFSREALQTEICRASFAVEGAEPTQVRYLGSYLSHPEAKAQTILIEAPYVDRHYLEEYAHYYATTLRPPPPKATRLHFFRNDLTDEVFTELITQAADGNFAEICKNLSANYLGFAVIRPLPDAPIGRTVLTTFQALDRCYTLPPHPYRVHLCGLKLSVCGVPFQQQEQAVGACATTAVWSALAQVMRHDGGRAPTPYAVTEAATRNWLSDRIFPAASGLKNEQILEAIRQFGYAPLFFEPRLKTELFALAVKCYLRSGIPVILKIQYANNDETHAVTLVGFREDDSTIDYQEVGWTSFALKSKGFCRLYIHDDRLGPYARAEWRVCENGFIQLKFLPGEPGYEDFCDEAIVEAAMVPLYPKIRLSAQDLVAFAGELLPMFREIVGSASRDHLNIDIRFCLAGECLELLYMSQIPAKRFAEFARQAVLSRYVGLITYYVADQIVAYILCDSTDMHRGAPAAAPLLAIIPQYEEHIEALRKYMPGALIL
jgi:hypothetical protein